MNRTIFTILLASMSICLSLSVASCQPRSSKPEGKGLAEGKEQGKEKEIEERVTSIYNAVFNWYNTHHGVGEEHQYDDEFLTQDFLMLQSELDSISKVFNEYPSILVDFEHWTQAYDYDREQMDFSVDSIDVYARDSAKVYMSIFKDGTCFKSVLLKLAYTDSHQCPSSKVWLIDDFCVDGALGPYSFSNKRCLQECIADYQKRNLRTNK